MWPFKKKNKPAPPQELALKWYPVGKENPYDAPILDLRAFTLNVMASTQDVAIAACYSQSRTSNGQEFIGKEPANPCHYPIKILLDHNGQALEGVVFKSQTMEVKWDIYAYEGWLYFVRSWSAELMFKAKFIITANALEINEVIAAEGYTQHELENIYPLLLTHAVGHVWPFYIPEIMQNAEPQKIAIYLFGQFGSKATLATQQSVLSVKLVAV